MLILTSFLLVLSLAHQTRSQQCGAFTTRDVEGPFFIANADLNYAIAPSNEIGDSREGVILRGQVVDGNCRAIPGATVEVWYAGGNPVEYKFRPDKLWYRGKSQTNQNGVYKFLATFPGTYSGRPIPHYHYIVSTPGRNGKSLTTQVYFRDRVPRSYENYVRTRGSQFASVRQVGSGGGLKNGGRVVNFNVRIDV